MVSQAKFIGKEACISVSRLLTTGRNAQVLSLARVRGFNTVVGPDLLASPDPHLSTD